MNYSISVPRLAGFPILVNDAMNATIFHGLTIVNMHGMELTIFTKNEFYAAKSGFFIKLTFK